MQGLWTSWNTYLDAHVDFLLKVLLYIVGIIVSFIFAKVVIRIGVSFVNRIMQLRTVKMDERRRATLNSLFDNIIRYTVYVVWALVVLANLNVHIETLLAGAGIAGLAVGFGAQSLIRDVLTGLFILFEDQYGVGDQVSINKFTGTVVSIGLRLTRLQAWTGEIEIIPNGQIKEVTNYSKSNSIAVMDIAISYDVDIEKAKAIIEDTLEQVKAESEDVVGKAQVLGVQSLAEAHVLIRATMECKPTTQFGVQRMAYQRIKNAFDAQGIERPRTTSN